MPAAALISHPATPCEFIRAVTVDVQPLRAGALRLSYRMEGDISRLKVPQRRQPVRADELWRHTCCEVFLRASHTPAYAEFNFSPAGEWAAYDFDGYRSGMKAIEPIAPPAITSTRSPQHLQIDVELELPQWISNAAANEVHAALSAVLEDVDGGISYWALAHPGAKPDFHDVAGFTFEIPSDSR